MYVCMYLSQGIKVVFIFFVNVRQSVIHSFIQSVIYYIIIIHNNTSGVFVTFSFYFIYFWFMFINQWQQQQDITKIIITKTTTICVRTKTTKINKHLSLKAFFLLVCYSPLKRKMKRKKRKFLRNKRVQIHIHSYR